PLIVQRTGPAAARRMMLTAMRIDASEALRLGIVDEIVESAADFHELEAGLRSRVRRCAPRANAVTKQLVHASRQLPIDKMIGRAADEFAACLLGDEGREGIASFLERRKPGWAL